MPVKERARRPSVDTHEDLAASLASALVWLDIATTSLDEGHLAGTRHSLTQVRLQLRAAVRRLRGHE